MSAAMFATAASRVLKIASAELFSLVERCSAAAVVAVGLSQSFSLSGNPDKEQI